jgi:hypothetical protein
MVAKKKRAGRDMPKERRDAKRMLDKAERAYLEKRAGKEAGFSWGAFAGCELVKMTKGPKKGRVVLAIHEVHVFSKADARALATKGMKFIPHISKAIEGERFGGER